MLTPLNQQLGQAPSPSMAITSPTAQVAKPPMVAPAPTMPAQGIGEQMAAQGRGPDSMLVHMAPEEVKGLQQLAMAHGGSLTINPVTGLPEAGFLKKLLPMILGAGVSLIPGVGPLMAAGIVGAGYGVVKKDLKAGLMAGLSAFGGAGLAGAATGMATSMGANAATQAATTGAQAATPGLSELGAQVASKVPSSIGNSIMGGQFAGAGAQAVGAGTQAATQAASSGLGGLMSGAKTAGTAFGNALREDIPASMAKYVPRAVTTGLGATGVMNTLSSAMTPGPMKLPTSTTGKSNYAGPYLPANRQVRMPGADRSPTDSSEFQYFDNVNPFPAYQTASGGVPPGYPGAGAPAAQSLDPRLKILGSLAPKLFTDPVTGQLRYPEQGEQGMADGGVVALKPGGFVMDAKTVSELGNGSSSAGQELLARYGGKAIEGRGDGVSDSIPAKIDGKRRDQRARVARDEVKFDPKAVKRLGGGDAKKGAQRLYALMDQARHTRASVPRGEDSGLRRGLA